MPRGRLYSFLRPSAARDLDRYLRIRPSSSGGHARPYGGRNPKDVLPTGVGGACGEVAGPPPPPGSGLGGGVPNSHPPGVVAPLSPPPPPGPRPRAPAAWAPPQHPTPSRRGGG